MRGMNYILALLAVIASCILAAWLISKMMDG
jgi:flagellar biogenesis protein FliO